MKKREPSELCTQLRCYSARQPIRRELGNARRPALDHMARPPTQRRGTAQHLRRQAMTTLERTVPRRAKFSPTSHGQTGSGTPQQTQVTGASKNPPPRIHSYEWEKAPERHKRGGKRRRKEAAEGKEATASGASGTHRVALVQASNVWLLLLPSSPHVAFLTNAARPLRQAWRSWATLGQSALRMTPHAILGSVQRAASCDASSKKADDDAIAPVGLKDCCIKRKPGPTRQCERRCRTPPPPKPKWFGIPGPEPVPCPVTTATVGGCDPRYPPTRMAASKRRAFGDRPPSMRSPPSASKSPGSSGMGLASRPGTSVERRTPRPRPKWPTTDDPHRNPPRTKPRPDRDRTSTPRAMKGPSAPHPPRATPEWRQSARGRRRIKTIIKP